MKYLSIDYGQKRSGIALSDAEGRMAFPRLTLAMRGKDIFFAELLALAESEKAQAFVIGLPLRSSGEDSESTRQVRNMAARLKRRSALPIYLMPEFLSSYAAEEFLREAGARLRRKDGTRAADHGRLDRAAAAAILESFLALAPHERERLRL